MNEITIRQNVEIIPGANILTLIEDWHDHLTLLVRTGEISANTRAAYVRGWSRFQDWLLVQNIDQVDADNIREWMAELKETEYKPGKKYKPNTVNTWLAGVRSLFSWAVGNRRLLLNPMEGVKSASRKGTSKKHKRSMLTNKEVKRVLDQPDRSTAQGKRDFAILSLMAYTAARTIEMHRADLADLQTEGDRLVLYVQGKGHEEKDEMIVIAHPEAETAVHDWLADRGDQSGPLFTSLSNRAKNNRLSLRSIRRLVKDYYKAAGVRGDDKTTHSLRHTAITSAVLHGAPVQKVKSMARHSSVDTTLIYFHEVDRIEDPAEAYINYDMRAF